MDTEANDLKVRENRLRRAATRQGLFLSRRRRRDPNALDYGLYALFRGGPNGQAVAGVGYGGVYGLTLAQVEKILAAGEEKAEPEPVAAQPDPPAAEPQNQPEPGTVPVRRSGGRAARRVRDRSR